MESQKQYTPEEIAKLEKSRTISDAELLNAGAECVIEGGEKRLDLTGSDLLEKYASVINEIGTCKDHQARVMTMNGKALREHNKLIDDARTNGSSNPFLQMGRRDSHSATVSVLEADGVHAYKDRFGEVRISSDKNGNTFLYLGRFEDRNPAIPVEKVLDIEYFHVPF